jgi:hypothetical protein
MRGLTSGHEGLPVAKDRVAALTKRHENCVDDELWSADMDAARFVLVPDEPLADDFRLRAGGGNRERQHEKKRYGVAHAGEYRPEQCALSEANKKVSPLTSEVPDRNNLGNTSDF